MITKCMCVFFRYVFIVVTKVQWITTSSRSSGSFTMNYAVDGALELDDPLSWNFWYGVWLQVDFQKQVVIYWVTAFDRYCCYIERFFMPRVNI